MVAKIKNKIFNGKNLLILAVIGLIALFIAKSDVYVKTTYRGVLVWGTAVLPSLLPFFFLTALVTKTGSVVKLSEKLTPVSKFLYNADGVSLYIRLTSLISGYPVGAKLICDLYKSGKITARQAEKYCTFTSTSGPLFIIGAVAISAYGNKYYGFIMLLSHVLSSCLVGVIFRKMPDNGLIAPLFQQDDCDNVLYESMYSAVLSVLLVGGFVAVFFTVSEMANDLKILYPLQKFLSLFLDEKLAEGFSLGLIECTKGTVMLAKASKGKLSCALSCALISFGGLSVWFQSLTYLKTAKVRVFIFAAAKILHTIIAFSLCYILLSLL